MAPSRGVHVTYIFPFLPILIPIPPPPHSFLRDWMPSTRVERTTHSTITLSLFIFGLLRARVFEMGPQPRFRPRRPFNPRIDDTFTLNISVIFLHHPASPLPSPFFMNRFFLHTPNPDTYFPKVFITVNFIQHTALLFQRFHLTPSESSDRNWNVSNMNLS
ncbi:uncharacterized protein EI90DRAFT_532336 [Cantharellus anzutake]|uniref:uncharacterized protein n=1 Tax=Cantharellus anzutake TaxID=1750568 RepID=UPI001902FED1|nr:uncharacterized protein EI90DRAFT_532336 [Cantharellus anzutake]KAF8334275.1 hypothetical protein EI90DRAFT_532336 [Cantharellus anzutake]